MAPVATPVCARCAAAWSANDLAVAATSARTSNIFLSSFPSSLFHFLCLTLNFLPAGKYLYFTLDVEGVIRLASLGDLSFLGVSAIRLGFLLCPSSFLDLRLFLCFCWLRDRGILAISPPT